MDRSAAPWRVLDEHSVAGGSNPGGEADREEPRGALAGIGWGTIAAVAVAAVLAIAAFAIAASGSSGTVAVDSADGGGVAAPFGSGGLATPDARSAGADLVVDVQGAVVRPGVLHLPPGSRVGDAVAAAGGYGPRVDTQRAGRELNLAATLKDGDRVVVPSRDDPPGSAGGGADEGDGSGAGGEGPVDLNRATASELDALPGVGPVTAQKIIDAREEQPFASVDDLRTRKIVGASAFERLRELVTVH
jgi:competence protein ComEA